MDIAVEGFVVGCGVGVPLLYTWKFAPFFPLPRPLFFVGEFKVRISSGVAFSAFGKMLAYKL